MERVVDSALTREEILAQNPESPAPDEILAAIDVSSVRYLGYDGKIHEGQIAMHKSLLPEIDTFFTAALTLGFPIEKVIPIAVPAYHWDDEASCNDNNSSGYNYRVIHGTNRLSKHARGLAFDINPRQNIYIRFDDLGKEVFRAPADGVYDPAVPGTLTSDHPLVTLMEGLGWEWGGRWRYSSGRVDYQHFEKEV